MIRVLIVDDEYLIRQLIRTVVDWEALGFEVVGEAADSQQTMEQMLQLAPQLVLLDINLPVVSGIDLCRSIRERFPETLVVMLTGYNRFEYARECLRQGVLDYLLKPLDEQELIKTLHKAARVLGSRTQQRQLQMPVDSYADRSGFAVQMQKLCGNGGRIVCAAVEIDRLRRRFQHRADQMKWLGAVERMCGDYLRGAGIGVCTMVEYPYLLLAVAQNGECLPLPGLLGELRDYIGTNADLTVSIGVGPLVAVADANVPVDAIRALDRKFLTGKSGIYPIACSRTVYPTAPNELEKSVDMLSLLRGQDMLAIQRAIAGVFANAAARNFCRDYIALLAASMINDVICYCVEFGLDAQEAVVSRDDYLLHIQECESIEELESMVRGLYRSIQEQASQQDTSRSRQLVDLTVRQIEENYRDDNLTLGAIAAALFINANYLSKVFKQHMNISVSEYIIRYRLQKARILIEENGDLRIVDVAKQVGYADPFYFSKSFKKQFGISPSKFLERVRAARAR